MNWTHPPPQCPGKLEEMHRGFEANIIPSPSSSRWPLPSTPSLARQILPSVIFQVSSKALRPCKSSFPSFAIADSPRQEPPRTHRLPRPLPPPSLPRTRAPPTPRFFFFFFYLRSAAGQQLLQRLRIGLPVGLPCRRKGLALPEPLSDPKLPERAASPSHLPRGNRIQEAQFPGPLQRFHQLPTDTQKSVTSGPTEPISGMWGRFLVRGSGWWGGGAGEGAGREEGEKTQQASAANAAGLV